MSLKGVTYLEENWEQEVRQKVLDYYMKNSFGDQNLILEGRTKLEKIITEELEKMKKVQRFEFEKGLRQKFESSFFLAKQEIL